MEGEDRGGKFYRFKENIKCLKSDSIKHTLKVANPEFNETSQHGCTFFSSHVHDHCASAE